MVYVRHPRLLAVAVAGSLCVMLLCAAPATAATGGGQVVPLGFLGLPSLHEIIEAIAKGFFSALAGALVPGFLKHGTVATIQHLVALPDPASWGHVSELESDMTFLGMSLMPVTLTVCVLRYWMMGLSGAAHPVTALGRCVWATAALGTYRWLVEQTVAATNTITHAILGFPVVANGLASIITVLFAGALLAGAGGVFGAVLVIVGVVFAATLFACAEALTVLLALVFCAGPPFIALAPIPELSHLARVWGHALLAIMLVPIGWTILFATAGALTLDATSVTHGAGGLPGHVAAAFAGLITFILAVKLPLMLFGELRHILGGALRNTSPPGAGSQNQSALPGVERIRAANARMRSFAVDGMPAMGRSVGEAAGAMGAPQGGALGAARRGLAGAARRSGLVSAITPAAAGAGAGALGGVVAGAAARGGVRERLGRARSIIAGAPAQARAAMTAASSSGGARAVTQRGARSGAAAANGSTQARAGKGRGCGGLTGSGNPAKRASGGGSPTPRTVPRTPPAVSASEGSPRPKRAGQDTQRPGRRVAPSPERDVTPPPRPPGKPAANPSAAQSKRRRAVPARRKPKNRGGRR